MKWGLVSFVVFGSGFWLGSTRLQSRSETQLQEKSQSRIPNQEHGTIHQNLPTQARDTSSTRNSNNESLTGHSLTGSIERLSDPKVWPLERLRDEKRKQEAAFEERIFIPHLLESAYTTTNPDAARKIVDGWQLKLETEAKRLFEKSARLRGLFSYTHKNQLISGTILWVPHCGEYGCHFEKRLNFPGKPDIYSYRSSTESLGVKENLLVDEFRFNGEVASFGLAYFYTVPIHQEIKKFWLHTSEMSVIQGEVSWTELLP